MKNKTKIIILLIVISIISIAIISKNFEENKEDTASIIHIPVSESPRVYNPIIGNKEIDKDKTSLLDKDVSKEFETIDVSEEAIANWDTCRNEEYGYEFKYPSGWYMYKVFIGTESGYHKKISTCGGSFITLSQKTIISPGQTPPTIGVRFLTNRWTGSLQEYLQTQTFNNKLNPIINWEEYNIDEAKIIQYNSQYSLERILFSYKGNIFNLSVDTQDRENQSEFLNAVISTLKFID